MFKVIYIYHIYSYVKVKQKIYKAKEKKRHMYMFTLSQKTIKETQLLGFTKFTPYTLPPFIPRVLQVLCRDKAHGR